VEVGAHIEALRLEGTLLVEAGRSSDLAAPVPTCPDWVMRDLLTHVGSVHRWATSHLSARSNDRIEKLAEPALLAVGPPDDELCEWVTEGHAALVRALADAPADLDCWTFLAAPSPLSMWARRQAHETTIHRFDAELAAGRNPSTVAPRFASDGIDELLFAFLSRSAASSPDPPIGRLGLDAIDRDETWTALVLERGVLAETGLDECELIVRGSAADLYLLLWNRRPTAGLEIVGRAELLDDWADRFRVRWS
jgi:uncharacterized protein (TIGR03083 family)